MNAEQEADGFIVDIAPKKTRRKKRSTWRRSAKRAAPHFLGGSAATGLWFILSFISSQQHSVDAGLALACMVAGICVYRIAKNHPRTAAWTAAAIDLEAAGIVVANLFLSKEEVLTLYSLSIPLVVMFILAQFTTLRREYASRPSPRRPGH